MKHPDNKGNSKVISWKMMLRDILSPCKSHKKMLLQQNLNYFPWGAFKHCSGSNVAYFMVAQLAACPHLHIFTKLYP